MRDGGELSDGQIDWVVHAFTRGDVHAEQMSALAMAILLRGMTRRESARWTDAMIRSGLLEPGMAFLEKPFNPDHLARKVHELLCT